MKTLIIEKDRWQSLVEDMTKRFKVYSLAEKDGSDRYEQINAYKDIRQRRQSKIPSKEILLPKCETLLNYEVQSGNVKIEEPQVKMEKTVLLGVPPCEARSFKIIQDAYSSGEFKDFYYLRRRERTIIIGKACEKPLNTCFCTSVGGNPSSREGSDIFLEDLGDRYLVESLTEKGEELLESNKAFQDASPADIEKATCIARITKESIKTPIELQKIEEKLEKLFNDPLWNRVNQKCVGCGVCTYLCPTCFCFDIVDESQGSKGKRMRLWDSCQFTAFTLQGSGENPRLSNKERMRQRIMHKFNYYPKAYGQIACVGCGRCIRECPVNLDIREVLRTITSKE